MFLRRILTAAASAWVLIGGVAAAETAESPALEAGVVHAAVNPYGADRYDTYRPRRYTWRPWYSESHRRAPTYYGYAPRWPYDAPYNWGSRYNYDTPRSHGRRQPYGRYYGRRPYYDRGYDERWTATPPYPLPRWAGAPRYDEAPSLRWRSW